MKLGFGRVVPHVDGEETTTLAPRPALRLARVAPAALLAAEERARAVVARAEAEARAIVEAARAEAAASAERAAAEARSEIAAGFAAREIELSAREHAALERSFDDVVEVSRLLAERLLGEALALDPTLVAALARQALTEAHGARAVTIVAHPADVPLLERALAARELPNVVRIAADPARARASLRLETNVGVLDADLAPQLDRLAQKLRDLARNG